jgi:hypothetical protein
LIAGTVIVVEERELLSKREVIRRELRRSFRWPECQNAAGGLDAVGPALLCAQLDGLKTLVRARRHVLLALCVNFVVTGVFSLLSPFQRSGFNAGNLEGAASAF